MSLHRWLTPIALAGCLALLLLGAIQSPADTKTPLLARVTARLDDPPAKSKATPPTKKRNEEEEDPPAKASPPTPKKRAEEEDDRPVKSGVERLDQQAGNLPAPKKRADSAPIDLARAARDARHPRVKALFSLLQTPHDEVILKRFGGVTKEGGKTGGRLKVQPLPELIANLKEFQGTLDLQVMGDDGKLIREEKADRSVIGEVRYYENLAIDGVRDFLQDNTPATPEAPEISRIEKLRHVEIVLSHVLRTHESARLQGIRKGDGWDEPKQRLRDQLLDVQIEQMNLLGAARSWDAAFDLARDIVEKYRATRDQARLAKPMGDLVRQALEDPNFAQNRMREARARFREIEDAFPNSDILKPIGESLQKQARQLKELAEGLKRDKKLPEALDAVRQAEEFWPELPGLRSLRIEIDTSYQILKVAVGDRPKYASPGWACTELEHRCVELLFESLVSLTPDDQGALYYRPNLAEGLPRVVPMGRQFKLPRQARWSDDKPLNVGDLRFTLNLLRRGGLVGRSPAWGELLEGVDAGADPTRVKVRLRQGWLDPLGAMSFKILPARSKPDPVGEEFADLPISSGPFVLADRLSSPNATAAVTFRANPFYGIRAEKSNQPRLKEIQMIRSDNPVKDLREKTVDLALDLSSEQAAELRKEGYSVTIPTSRSSNRRIWFLAVNHRRPALAIPEIRLGLARAIDREKLLDEFFRKGLNRQVHRALNGPYPAGSWACDPNLVSRTDKDSLDPHDADLARTKFKQGMTRLGSGQVTLTLKFPLGSSPMDKQLVPAMEALCKQVNALLPGVKLEAQGRLPHELRREVEETHNYDLAYYFHDFADETLWLQPLLGPVGRGGGENFLGYTGSVLSRIQAASSLRNFSQVRDYAHVIHRQILETDMPLIPLWQLDPLHAFRSNVLEPGAPIDPILVFTGAENWRVRSSGK